MSDVVYTGLSWVALTPDEEGESTEIFFRGQDVVDGLRAYARLYEEASADAEEEGDEVKAALASAFSRWINSEADTYDVAVMQAMLSHEADDE
jgi:hypothetical protein